MADIQFCWDDDEMGCVCGHDCPPTVPMYDVGRVHPVEVKVTGNTVSEVPAPELAPLPLVPCVPCGGEGQAFDRELMNWTADPCPYCQGTGSNYGTFSLGSE